jgi:hypothetical protein
LRSKSKWIEEGEKPSIFCNLEKHNYLNKTILKLEKEVIKEQPHIT